MLHFEVGTPILIPADHSPLRGFQAVVDTALERAGAGLSNAASTYRLEARQWRVVGVQECTRTRRALCDYYVITM